LWLRSVSAATRSTTASTKSDSTELQSALGPINPAFA
jgi:hypothetical protein